MGEDLYELPKGWVWVISSEVCASVRDGTHDTPKYVEQGVPLITSKNLTESGLDFSTAKNISWEDHQNISIRSAVEKGDILFAMIGTIGNPVVVRTDKIFSIKNIGLFKKDEFVINSDYLKYWLSCIVFTKIIENKGLLKGTTQKFIPLGYLRIIDIPLPPLPEQYRIVAKIEELLTELDAGVELLKKLKAKLKRYRQAVLKAAVEGSLTQEWRTANQDKLEPASILLERILKQRREKWEAEQLAKMTAQGKTPKDDSWKQKYKEPIAPDTSDLPELPDGWVWVNLGQITWSVKDGPHYSPKYVNEGIPFITGGNVRPSGVDFANAKRITPELYTELSKKCKPEKGDILYTKGGTTGIARVNTYDIEFNVWVHVAVLKLAGLVEPFYIQHSLNSPFCYSQSQHFTHGVGNQDLGLTRMIKIVLSLPPQDEQKKIIDEIEYLYSVIDQLEKTVDVNLKRAEKLRQSILKQAFEGKLVPQDPNDEPAEKLLERIKAEKAKQTTTKTKKKTQSKTQSNLQLELPLK
jgi:type I restriction enzyme S subunit